MDRSTAAPPVKTGVRHWFEDPHAGVIGLYERPSVHAERGDELREGDRWPEPGRECHVVTAVPDPESLVLLPHELDGREDAPGAVVACGLMDPASGRWRPPSLVRGCERLFEGLNPTDTGEAALLEEPVPSLEFLFLEAAKRPGISRAFSGWRVPLHRGRAPFAVPEPAVQALIQVRNGLRSRGRVESPLPRDRREAVRARSTILAQGA